MAIPTTNLKLNQQPVDAVGGEEARALEEGVEMDCTSGGCLQPLGREEGGDHADGARDGGGKETGT